MTGVAAQHICGNELQRLVLGRIKQVRKRLDLPARFERTPSVQPPLCHLTPLHRLNQRTVLAGKLLQ